MVDRSLGEVRLARTGHARAAGRVSAGERHSVACLLAAERARHRVAVDLDGQEVREEARRLRRFRKATIDVKSTELVLRPGTAVVTTPLALLVSLDEQGAVHDSVICSLNGTLGLSR